MILQPSDLFELLRVKNTKETEKVLSFTINFLSYMRVGDILQTSLTTFEKVGDDLLYIDTKLNPNAVIDSLNKGRIINLPL